MITGFTYENLIKIGFLNSDIEKNLKVNYCGQNNREEAHLFIKQYKDENRKFNIKNKIKFPPTGKQLRYIKDIEKVTEKEFIGKTLKEASKFIEKNLDEFKLNQDFTFNKFKNLCNRKADKIQRKQRMRKRYA